MPKITLIGAGSVVFARRLTLDILTWPELAEGTLALMDIDPEGLELTYQLLQRIVKERNLPTKLLATTERRAALEGADYVITAIDVGGREMRAHDFKIPRRYGVHQVVADTLGPGGVFRALRTTPVLLDIAHDMEELCPHALLINYANPMNINMWAVQACTRIRSVGLCHSVQGTAQQLAGYMGIPYEELTYWVAGINHQAWFLELRRGTYRGEDLYPRLRQCIEAPDIYNRDSVRFEVMRHFGYFVTESSPHMSEYTPWFRRTPELRARFEPLHWQREKLKQGRTDEHPDQFLPEERGAQARTEQMERARAELEKADSLSFDRSHEYCSYILHAIETNTPFRFNGNVMNTGLITNLPPGCNVEAPILVDNAGLHPCYVGDLPSQCAAINRTNINVQELAVKAILEKKREYVYQAIALDPLTCTQCSLDDVRQMTDELFAASAPYLRF